VEKGQKLGLVFLFFLVTSFCFFGCATLKKEECLTVDWYGIGYEDGTKGYKTSRIAKHRKSCAKYGVLPDLQLYQRGHSEGLREYCTPHKGYQLGLHGRSYNDVCQGELAVLFQEAYNIGKDNFFLKQEILKEQKYLGKLKGKRLQVNDLLKKKERDGKDCVGLKKCKKIIDDIWFLDKEKRVLHLKILSQKNLIAEMKQTLSDMTVQSRFK